ncbi:MAG: hypothetical protein JJ992_22255, partial [Planctomycetes bacterium]|nr:hypothetical protein [Planctomycetota bacterium]
MRRLALLDLCGKARIRAQEVGSDPLFVGQGSWSQRLMQALSLVTCLWPGLPHLWWRGDWRALMVGVFFAIVVNLGLLTT